MDIFKLLGVAMASVVLILAVRQAQPQIAALLSVAAGAILLVMVLPQVGAVVEYLESLGEQTSLSGGFFTVALKVTGIALLTDFAVQACQDAGEKGIAGKVEWAGKVVMLLAALPMLMSVLELLRKLAPQ